MRKEYIIRKGDSFKTESYSLNFLDVWFSTMTGYTLIENWLPFSEKVAFFFHSYISLGRMLCPDPILMLGFCLACDYSLVHIRTHNSVGSRATVCCTVLKRLYIITYYTHIIFHSSFIMNSETW